MKQYDVIFIGSGQAMGPIVPVFLKDGLKIALAESGKLGGTCLNYGCRPTKTLRASAKVANYVRRAQEYGIEVEAMSVNFGKVMARKDSIISNWQNGLTNWVENLDGLDLFRHHAKFDGKDGDSFVVTVGDEKITAPQVYLNTGTRAFVPPISGIDSVPYMTNIEMLELKTLPAELLILGGGYIGLEYAQMFARFGSKVTVIEGAGRVANREDEDVSLAIEEILISEGITIITNHFAKSVSQNGSKIVVQIEDQKYKQLKEISGTDLFVAIGRKPNTEDLNLESVGLTTDPRGFLETDEYLKTKVDGIWALGDMNGRGAFTHTSFQDGEIVIDNYLGGSRHIDRPSTYAMFTDPPMARVGISEKEALSSGKKILKAEYKMEYIGRAVEDGETAGFIKLLVDAETEQFLGAMILGKEGDEIIQVISYYMATGSTYRAMKEALPVHPTVAEFFPTILGGLKPIN